MIISRFLLIVFAGLLSLWIPKHAQAGKPDILVVFDMEVKRIRIKKDVLSALTDYLSTQLAETGRFELVPKEAVRSRLIDEKKKTHKACYDQSCQIEIGRELAANKTMASQVMKLGGKCVVTLKLYDLRKATVVRAVSAEGKCDEEGILVSIRKAVGKLTGAPSEPSPGAAKTTSWSPACKGDPATCLQRSRDLNKSGKSDEAFLLAVAAELEAQRKGAWMTAIQSWTFEVEVSKGYIPRQQAMETNLKEACNRKEADACSSYARFLHLVAKRHSEAAIHFQSLCDAGDMASCEYIGDWYHSGIGVSKDAPRAAKIRTHACKNGNMLCCNDLAIMYYDGEGVERDFKKSADFHRQACDGGLARSCNSLGLLYEDGKGVSTDINKAVSLYRKACDGDAMWGCNNLGNAHKNGVVVKKDYRKAAELYQKACELGVGNSCKELGFLYEDGVGVAKDYKKALSFYRKSCDKDHMDGCRVMGNVYKNAFEVKQDLKKAAEFYRKACDGGVPKSCKELGFLYEDGRGVPKDRNKALSLYRKSCDGDHMDGCRVMGNVYKNAFVVKQDLKKAAEFYRKACDGGVAKACNNLALCYERGEGVAKDIGEARALFKKACDGGFKDACKRVSKKKGGASF